MFTFCHANQLTWNTNPKAGLQNVPQAVHANLDQDELNGGFIPKWIFNKIFSKDQQYSFSPDFQYKIELRSKIYQQELQNRSCIFNNVSK